MSTKAKIKIGPLDEEAVSDLLWQFVRMAKHYHRDAMKSMAADKGTPTEHRHWDAYLRSRSVRHSYMHAAKLIRGQIKEAALRIERKRASRQHDRQMAKFRSYPAHKPNSVMMNERVRV